MSNETITYSLESVLKEIKDSIKEVNQKIDTLQQDVNQKIDSLEKRIDERFDKVEDRLTKLEIGQADLKGDIKVLDEKIEGLTVRVAPGAKGRSLTFLLPTLGPNPRHWLPCRHDSFVTLLPRTR